MKRLALTALAACAAGWAAALLEMGPAPSVAPLPLLEPAALVSPNATTARPAAKPSARLAPLAEISAHEAEARPHPITPEHRRLQRELQLVAALNDALDREDGPELRKLLELYRAHDPRDTQGLQAGYAQLADCLQHPGEAARQAARAYYESERASVLRRYVRHTCLER